MNIGKFILLFTILLVQSCQSQKAAEREIFNADFKWSITIPKNFENVSADEWSKLQNKGKIAIEDTYGEEIINNSKIIFVFKSDDLNYFESNYQPFDPSDGDYLATCENVNLVLYETFKAQMPNAKIEKRTTTEIVDQLEFQKFEMEVEYPNKMVLHLLMYSRLFDEKEFSVNIMFVDKAKGAEMLDSWKKSKFSK